jgi:hypothetical protein
MRGGAANLRFLIDAAAISIVEFQMQNRATGPVIARAFSSEVDTGSREASKQESKASVLIQSEPIMLWAPLIPKFASEVAAIAL